LNSVVRITDLTPEYAADIVTWRYSAPYGCYDHSALDTGGGLRRRPGTNLTRAEAAGSHERQAEL
jgi:hypothetical protein